MVFDCSATAAEDDDEEKEEEEEEEEEEAKALSDDFMAANRASTDSRWPRTATASHFGGRSGGYGYSGCPLRGAGPNCAPST